MLNESTKIHHYLDKEKQVKFLYSYTSLLNEVRAINDLRLNSLCLKVSLSSVKVGLILRFKSRVGSNRVKIKVGSKI